MIPTTGDFFFKFCSFYKLVLCWKFEFTIVKYNWRRILNLHSTRRWHHQIARIVSTNQIQLMMLFCCVIRCPLDIGPQGMIIVIVSWMDSSKAVKGLICASVGRQVQTSGVVGGVESCILCPKGFAAIPPSYQETPRTNPTLHVGERPQPPSNINCCQLLELSGYDGYYLPLVFNYNKSFGIWFRSTEIMFMHIIKKICILTFWWRKSIIQQ